MRIVVDHMKIVIFERGKRIKFDQKDGKRSYVMLSGTLNKYRLEEHETNQELVLLG